MGGLSRRNLKETEWILRGETIHEPRQRAQLLSSPLAPCSCVPLPQGPRSLLEDSQWQRIPCSPSPKPTPRACPSAYPPKDRWCPLDLRAGAQHVDMWTGMSTRVHTGLVAERPERRWEESSGCGCGWLSQSGHALVSTLGDLRALNTDLAFWVARAYSSRSKGTIECITVF